MHMSDNEPKQNEVVDDEKVYCRRCGRLLIGSSSKELGFGPTCYRIWKKEHSQQIPLFDMGDDSE